MSTLDLGLRFFLQLAVILACCRLAGWVGRRWLGQTQVVMEMVAGVALGPSLFGLLAPDWHGWLFVPTLTTLTEDGPIQLLHPSMAILFGLGQLGLVFYIFLVGIDLDTDHLRASLGSAGLISGAGIAVPFALGALLAIHFLARGGLFAPGVATPLAVLYLGASMSITAFPMLARILHERGLTGSRLGTLTLAAGAFDDAVAWCLLAIVVASITGNSGFAVLAVCGGAVYCVVMMTAGRRGLASVGRRWEERGALSAGAYSSILLLVVSCAAVADWIGIYAVFGAFVCGVAMPRGWLSREVVRRTEPLTVTVLLPIFFVYSGLATRIALLDSWNLWLLTAGIVAVAVVGKGAACCLAARISGEGWRDSAKIGTLMNARGLMELIILNVGLERGVITPRLFTIMVLMAVVTTLMTSPVYRWIEGSPTTGPRLR
ncbi:MAG: cation:proton antiporter [Thermoanaerobaculia bacterium]|nr:cation:proton antiporter [Thermoanaerobaculia bacterium]